MLRENTTLEQIHINGNNLGDEDALVLAEGLRHNSTLKWLNLQCKSTEWRGERETHTRLTTACLMPASRQRDWEARSAVPPGETEA